MSILDSDLHGLRYTLPVTEDLVQIFGSENISQSCLREESGKLIQLKLIVSPDCVRMELIVSVTSQQCLCPTDKLNLTTVMLLLLPWLQSPQLDPSYHIME